MRSSLDTLARHRLWVILGIETYLAVTFLIHLFGPLDFSESHYATLIVLVLAYQCALFAGFFLAERYVLLRAEVPTSRLKSGGVRDRTTLITVGLSLAVFFSYSSLAAYGQTWNPLRIVSTVAGSILDPGAAYVTNRTTEQFGTWITKGATLTAPLTFAAIVLGLYYFKSLAPATRALVVVGVIFQLLPAAIRGTNFGVFKITTVLLTLGLLYLLRRASRRLLTRATIVKGAGAIAVLVSAFVGYFVITTGDRQAGQDQPAVVAGVPIDYSSPLVSGLPDPLKSGAVLVSLYSSQGYHGLALTSDYDFSSTYGFGSSVFVMNNVERTFGWELFPRTYVHKMDPVWSESENWHTAYVWFANDVGLGGVVVVMLGIGAAFNIVLRGAEREDPLAIVLLPLLIMMLVFLPANNAVMSNPLTAMPLGILGAAYGLFLTRQNSWGQSIVRKVWLPLATSVQRRLGHFSGDSGPEPPR